MLKIGIVGIGGRMGHELYNSSLGMDSLKIIAGIDRNTVNYTGSNIEIVDKAHKLEVLPQILIDFSRPEFSLENLDFAKENNIRYILGTTGFNEIAKVKIKDISKSIAIVQAANFSIGINVLLSLMQKTASILPDADIEIVEAHHRYKVDAPSGTALAMGEAAAKGRNVNLNDVKVCSRDGITGERQYGTIGFSSIRGGDIVGEHEALFCCESEVLKLSHSAKSRSNFAQGALKAALWIADKKPGLYSMKEVLGLEKI